MTIPEACIKAAAVHRELTKNGWTEDTAEARARRVILALAENMPPEAVREARKAYGAAFTVIFDPNNDKAMCAALAAFLTHVAGDLP